MSTDIGIIHGKKEMYTPRSSATLIPEYEEQEMYLTRFSGGKERGTSLQITIDDQYIQLDGETADMLAMLLKDWRNAPEIGENSLCPNCGGEMVNTGCTDCHAEMSQ